MTDIVNQSIPAEGAAKSEESPKKERKPRLSKQARAYAQVYDKYNTLKVDELKAKLKELKVEVPLSRASKAMLISLLHEHTRPKKPKSVKKDENKDPNKQ